ncbi:MAG: hypothetical protein QOG03_353 [Actinomycetota bacterium]|nr:hypothetical protein [Actinomycetota bacterium]
MTHAESSPDAWLRILELEQELAAQAADRWVTLAEAEKAASVSRSALRTWYRSGRIPSRMVDGPHGPQRVVPLDAVLAVAEDSPRIARRVGKPTTMATAPAPTAETVITQVVTAATEQAARMGAEIGALRTKVDDLERRLAALEP